MEITLEENETNPDVDESGSFAVMRSLVSTALDIDRYLMLKL